MEKRLVEELRKAAEVAVASHVNPDGDGVGSLLALASALCREGKKVWASLPDPGDYPPQYLFLPGREILLSPHEFPEAPQVFVALDCSNLERLGGLAERARRSGLLVNIDHHEDNRRFGDLNEVDSEASSTSELITLLLDEAGWEITPDMATCLYTGIMTDTGRFQHRNTGPRAFRAAARLAAAGADVFSAAKEVYENQSLSYLHLVGVVLQRMEITGKRALAYSYITREDLRKTGASLSETEDLIDFMRMARGAEVVALFKELDDGRVRVSLRSRDGMDVGPIARALGGGGHAKAAGYTWDGDIRSGLEKLLEAVENAP